MSRPDETIVSDAELLALFRRRRPDPAEFRARVERRIREREEAARREEASDDGATRPTWRSELTRRAAAVIPVDPTGATGAAAAGKLFPTLLFLPFLVLAASFAAFAAALRSVRQSSHAAPPLRAEPDPWAHGRKPTSPHLRLAPWLVKSLQLAGMVVLLAPAVTGSVWAVDAQIAVFLLAGIALVVVVRGLAESALLTPRMVAQFACTILGMLFMGTFLWMGALGLVDPGSDLGSGWPAAVVLGGLVACTLLGRSAPGWRGTGWIVWTFVVVLLLNPLGVTHTSPRSLRGQLADMSLDAAAIGDWEGASQLHEALVAASAELPPSDAIEAELDRALAAPEIDVHPHVWTAALRMGLMTPERWSRLATRGRMASQLDQLLKARGALPLQGYDEYQVPLLLATRDVSETQCGHLAERVEASWPAPDRHDPIGQALLCVRLFEHLGETARIEAHREDVRDLLVRHWVAERTSRFGRYGGFTSDPVKFRTSFEHTTYDAIALMARYGVPAEIDLRRVRAFLRNESRATPLVFEWIPNLKAEQRAALLRLEREVGIPPRSWLASLLGERVLIAALLLVMLCFVAIRSAPAVDPDATRGAMP